MSTLERAIQIATGAHTSQVDKAGEPYILHPLRVMLNVSSPDERLVAVLHDVIEDSEITAKDLMLAGFSTTVIEAVVTLSKSQGISYEQYIEGVALNPLARIVKLADLADNSDISRIPNPSERDLERLEKYHRIRKILEEAIDSNP